MRALSPDFSYETAALARGARHVCGVDEAGRGPLCGPVVAAAVRLDPAHLPEGLNDSKSLSAVARARAHAAILASCDVGVGLASVAEMPVENFLSAGFTSLEQMLEADDEALSRIGGMTPTRMGNVRLALKLLAPAKAPEPAESTGEDAPEAEAEVPSDATDVADSGDATPGDETPGAGE